MGAVEYVEVSDVGLIIFTVVLVCSVFFAVLQLRFFHSRRHNINIQVRGVGMVMVQISSGIAWMLLTTMRILVPLSLPCRLRILETLAFYTHMSLMIVRPYLLFFSHMIQMEHEQAMKQAGPAGHLQYSSGWYTRHRNLVSPRSLRIVLFVAVLLPSLPRIVQTPTEHTFDSNIRSHKSITFDERCTWQGGLSTVLPMSIGLASVLFFIRIWVALIKHKDDIGIRFEFAAMILANISFHLLLFVLIKTVIDEETVKRYSLFPLTEVFVFNSLVYIACTKPALDTLTHRRRNRVSTAPDSSHKTALNALDEVLDDNNARGKFVKHLKARFALENLLAYDAATDILLSIRKLSIPAFSHVNVTSQHEHRRAIMDQCEVFYETFIDENSPAQLNIAGHLRNELREGIDKLQCNAAGANATNTTDVGKVHDEDKDKDTDKLLFNENYANATMEHIVGAVELSEYWGIAGSVEKIRTEASRILETDCLRPFLRKHKIEMQSLVP